MDKTIHKRIRKDKDGRIWIDRHIMIRQDLWEKCKKYGFNVSVLISELLDEFLALFEAFRHGKLVAPRGFEPRSPAPKAGRIDRYPTGLFKVLLSVTKNKVYPPLL